MHDVQFKYFKGSFITLLGLELHLWEDKVIFIFQKARSFENLKSLHGKNQGQGATRPTGQDFSAPYLL